MKDKKIIGDGLSKKEDTPPFREMREIVDKLVREEARILRNGKMRLHSTRRDRRPFLSNYGLLTLLHLYVPPPNATLKELSRARIFYENRPGGRYKDFKRYQDISIYTSPALTLYKNPDRIFILFRGKDKEMDTLLDLLENIKFEAFIEEKGYNRDNESWSKYYKRRVEQGIEIEEKKSDDGNDNEYALQYENFKKAHQNFSRRLFGKIISSRRFADAFYDANEGKDIVSYEKIDRLPENLTDLLTQLKDDGYKSEDMADNDEDGEEKEEGELVEEKDGEEKEEAPEDELIGEYSFDDLVIINKGKNYYVVDNENRILDLYDKEILGKWNEKTGEAEIDEGWEVDFTDEEIFTDEEWKAFVKKFEVINSQGKKIYINFEDRDKTKKTIYKRENGKMIKTDRFYVIKPPKKIKKKFIIMKQDEEEKKQDGEGHPIELRILKNKGKEYYVDNEGIIYNTTSGEQIGTWIKNRPVMY